MSFLWLPLPRPNSHVKNNSASTVHVTAFWREKSLDLGALAPGAATVFKVRDEAAMTIAVTFSDGRRETSDAIYFTSSTTHVFQIENDSITTEFDMRS